MEAGSNDGRHMGGVQYGRHMGGVYGDIDIFLGDRTCTCCNRKTCSVLGRNEASFASGDYYVWQKIFIDHRNDNRANRTSLKSLRGSRCSRMCTSTTTCVCTNEQTASLRSRWVG